jgi:hypothetical protein
LDDYTRLAGVSAFRFCCARAASGDAVMLAEDTATLQPLRKNVLNGISLVRPRAPLNKKIVNILRSGLSNTQGSNPSDAEKAFLALHKASGDGGADTFGDVGWTLLTRCDD